MHKSPLDLTGEQRIDAIERGKVVLNNRQIAHLRNSGLIATPDAWYYHPTGSFALAPSSEDVRKGNKRGRHSLAVVTTRKAA